MTRRRSVDHRILIMSARIAVIPTVCAGTCSPPHTLTNCHSAKASRSWPIQAVSPTQSSADGRSPVLLISARVHPSTPPSPLLKPVGERLVPTQTASGRSRDRTVAPLAGSIHPHTLCLLRSLTAMLPATAYLGLAI